MACERAENGVAHIVPLSAPVGFLVNKAPSNWRLAQHQQGSSIRGSLIRLTKSP
jgi:hypothetical protein